MAFAALARGLAMGGGEGALFKGGQQLTKGLGQQQAATQALAKGTEKTGQQLKSFSDRLRDVQQSALHAQAQAYILKSAIEGLSSTMVGMVTLHASMLKSIIDPIANLTQLSNPAAVQQLTLAFNDAMAVIGRGMLPIVQAFTRAIRITGDMYARLEPIILSVSNSIARGFTRVFDKLAKIWDTNGPAAELMASALEMVIDGVTELALQFLNLTKWITKAFNAIAKLFGFTGASTRPGASAFGASVRDVKFESNAEKIQQDATIKAFQAAMAAGKPQEKDVPSLLDKIAGVLDLKLSDIIKQMPTKDDVASAVIEFANAVVDAFKNMSKEDAKGLARDANSNWGIGGSSAVAREVGSGADIGGVRAAARIAAYMASMLTR